MEITSNLTISDDEFQFSFIRASGPGGQNINKVATACQLRFNVIGSPSLPEDVRMRLLKLAGSRITNDGQLLIEAKRFRTQEKNRQDALERLAALVRRAAEKPKTRRQTQPTRASQQRRLAVKKHRGEIKRLRSTNGHEQ